MKAYCIKDKDFTIDKADSNILPWVYKARSGDNTRVSLVDAITGETILSKYVSFVDLEFSESSDGKYLVAAEDKDGVYEIYEIG